MALDTSTQTVIILFTGNLLLLLVILILFGIIRKFRGDKAKVVIGNKTLKELGIDQDNKELVENLLLENPGISMHNACNLK